MPSRYALSALTRASITRSVPRSAIPSLSARAALHQSAFLASPRKNAQDKDSIDTEASEYSKSGTDDGAARQEEAAFDPSTTKPEDEHAQAGKGNEQNPLDVSPANKEVSKQRGQQEGGAENSPKEENSNSSGFGNQGKK